MTYEEARLLLQTKSIKIMDSLTKSERFCRGIRILSQYSADLPGSAEHDILYVATFPESMPEHEVVELRSLGFHLSEDSWCMFT